MRRSLSSAFTCVLVCLAGCGAETETRTSAETVHESAPGEVLPTNDACIYSRDGVCDEPVNCSFGSDATDCEAACAVGDPPVALHAACGFREGAGEVAPPDDPAKDVGTHGNGGRSGVWEGTIQARGPASASSLIDRYYRVYVPASYDPRRPAPLLYVMGGFRVDYTSLPAYTELTRTADLHGVILVYLQAHWVQFQKPLGYVYQWYVFKQNWSPSEWSENPDVDFIRRLTAHVKTLYNVDKTRVFVSGHSRGAGESIIVAHELPTIVAGYLSESGFSKVNDYEDVVKAYSGPRKVAGVLVHGTADPDVSVSESDATAKATVASGSQVYCVPSCPAFIATGAFADAQVLYYRLPKVTHQWQPQYNEQAWNFLAAHPLPLEMVSP